MWHASTAVRELYVLCDFSFLESYHPQRQFYTWAHHFCPSGESLDEKTRQALPISLPTVRSFIAAQILRIDVCGCRWQNRRAIEQHTEVNTIVLDIQAACWLPNRTPSMTDAAPSSGMKSAIRGMHRLTNEMTEASDVNNVAMSCLKWNKEDSMMTPATNVRDSVLLKTAEADSLSDLPK